MGSIKLPTVCTETELRHCRLHLRALQTSGAALPIPWLAPETMRHQKYSASA